MTLTSAWQHIAMEPVFTKPTHQGHEIQISFLVGMVAADFFFDDIQLYELDVWPSPASRRVAPCRAVLSAVLSCVALPQPPPPPS